jgi:hypothetical protein
MNRIRIRFVVLLAGVSPSCRGVLISDERAPAPEP